MPRPGRSNCPDQHLSDAYAIDSETNHYDSKKNRDYSAGRHDARLTMRLSDAGLRRRETKVIYLNHPLLPWLAEAAPPRSLQLLGSGRSRLADGAINYQAH
jgi:hypothetical protein